MTRGGARVLRTILFTLPLLAAAAYAWPQHGGAFGRLNESSVRPRGSTRRSVVDQRRVRQIATSARRSGLPSTSSTAAVLGARRREDP